MKALFQELKRRRVFKVSAAYAVVGWIMIEVSSTIFPALMLPDWTITFVTALIIIGFPIAVVVAWIFDFTKDGIVVTSPSLVAIADREGESGGEAIAVGAVPPTSESALAAVAVMPFDNVTPTSPHGYVADAITAELQNSLSSVPQLRVVSRQSTLALGSDRRDIKHIADELDVQYLISGSVTHLGEKIRVIAELADTEQDAQLWSETYDLVPTEILTVLEEIKISIVSNFGGVRLRKEIELARASNTSNHSAWELVRKAGAYLLDYNATSVEEAVTLLQEAIELDPKYAVAHATLGLVTAEKTLSAIGEDPDGDRQAALESTKYAISLTPRDPTVLRAAGCVHAYCGDYRRAENFLRQAIDIAPYDLGTWGYLGWSLVAYGDADKLQELHEILNRLLKMAPRHPGRAYWLFHQSVAYCCDGHFERSLTTIEQSLAEQPRFALGWMHAANIYGHSDRFADANAAVVECSRLTHKLDAEYYMGLMGVLSDQDKVVDQRCAGLCTLIARQS